MNWTGVIAKGEQEEKLCGSWKRTRNNKSAIAITARAVTSLDPKPRLPLCCCNFTYFTKIIFVEWSENSFQRTQYELLLDAISIGVATLLVTTLVVYQACSYRGRQGAKLVQQLGVRLR
jgi:hypothetical protein